MNVEDVTLTGSYFGPSCVTSTQYKSLTCSGEMFHHHFASTNTISFKYGRGLESCDTVDHDLRHCFHLPDALPDRIGPMLYLFKHPSGTLLA